MEADKHASILAATAPSDQSFIVESAENRTQPGDTVSNAAPIMSVAGADLPVEKPVKKRKGGLIVSDAVAEEVVLNSPNITPVPRITDTKPIPLDSSMDASEEKNEPVPADIPTNTRVVVSGHFYVQVGSFSQEVNAQKMKDAIRSVGPSSVSKIDINGAEWFRLRAGPFATQEEASEAMEKIRNLGAPDARIMKL